jgi:AcrR family transcriptional regulator
VHRPRGASAPGRAGRGRHRNGLDARHGKGVQNRRALLDALVALVDEGTTRPTVPQIARRAGVSVRTVYHQFDSIRQLLEAGVYLQATRHRAMLFTIPPRGTSELRITALCRQRRFYFEKVTPIRRFALSRASQGVTPETLADADRAILRDQLAHTLAPELDMRGDHGPDLLDALEHATGWDAWNGLRDGRARSPTSAERVMALTATSLLT